MYFYKQLIFLYIIMRNLFQIGRNISAWLHDKYLAKLRTRYFSWRILLEFLKCLNLAWEWLRIGISVIRLTAVGVMRLLAFRLMCVRPFKAGSQYPEGCYRQSCRSREPGFRAGEATIAARLKNKDFITVPFHRINSSSSSRVKTRGGFCPGNKAALIKPRGTVDVVSGWSSDCWPARDKQFGGQFDFERSRSSIKKKSTFLPHLSEI